METRLLSFASRCFYTSQKNLNKSAGEIGITKHFSWKYIRLVFTFFFWRHLKILRSKRGAGYWAWQPYIIRKSLEAVADGDVVIFCDSGLTFLRDIKPLEGLIIENDVLLFSAGNHINSEYTKRDCFILMDCDKAEYWKAPQVMGGFHIWKKNERSLKILGDYYKYCTNYQVVSDSKNKYADNFDDFIDHRHPQSILSLLAIKHQLKICTCPILFPEKAETQDLKFARNRITDTGFNKPFLLAHRTRSYSFLDKLLLKTGLWI